MQVGNFRISPKVIGSVSFAPSLRPLRFACPSTESGQGDRLAQMTESETLRSFPPDRFSGTFIAKTRHSAICVLGMSCDCSWAVCGQPSVGKGFLALSFPLVEAAMCSAFDCGIDMRRWP